MGTKWLLTSGGFQYQQRIRRFQRDVHFGEQRLCAPLQMRFPPAPVVRLLKDKKLLFTPRHDFFSLDAGALYFRFLKKVS